MTISNVMEAIPDAVQGYVKGLLVLLLFIPVHELVHAGSCIGLGGSLSQLSVSHMICGGNVQHMMLYNVLNHVNDVAVTFIWYGYAARHHMLHVVSPMISRYIGGPVR